MLIALVHGAYHGAWCWERLTPHLHARGHDVSAAELPCDRPGAGAEAYADAVVRALPRVGPDLVVVGHSLGGLTIPLVAERVPVRLLVFLCALVPIVGSSFDDQPPTAGSGYVPRVVPVADEDGCAAWPPRGAADVYYDDCPPRVAAEAEARLRRQCWRVTQERTPLREWPAVPAAAIVARGDRALSPDYCRAAARTLLGVEPVEIDGDHSPFLSRPAELAAVLDELASRA